MVDLLRMSGLACAEQHQHQASRAHALNSVSNFSKSVGILLLKAGAWPQCFVE